MNSAEQKKYEMKCSELARLAGRFLDFERWGLRQSAQLATKFPPTIIYDSEWCRVKIYWDGWDAYTGDTAKIYYGRLHAPNDAVVMTFNDEPCFCWHRVIETLNFLDGLSPQETVDQMRLYNQWPRIIEQFRKLNLGKDIPSSEWEVRLHAAIWEHYGQRLFEVFDIRKPDLWNQYKRFISEYHAIKGHTTPFPGYPSEDKIC